MLHPLPLPLSSCLGCIPPLIGLPSLRFYAVGSSLFLLSVCFCLCSLFYRDDVLCWLLLARPFLYAFHAHLRFPVDLVWFRLSCDHGWIRSGSVNVRKQQQQPWACLSRNLFLASLQTLWTRVFSRRTALISCLSWVSALCRFQAARLAAIAMLISASAWASPLQPRPGSLVARGGAIRSAVCSMAVVKAVSTSSTLLPLGGNALRWSPIAVATCWRNWGSVISLRRSIGGGPFASLTV